MHCMPEPCSSTCTTDQINKTSRNNPRNKNNELSKREQCLLVDCILYFFAIRQASNGSDRWPDPTPKTLGFWLPIFRAFWKKNCLYSLCLSMIIIFLHFFHMFFFLSLLSSIYLQNCRHGMKESNVIEEAVSNPKVHQSLWKIVEWRETEKKSGKLFARNDRAKIVIATFGINKIALGC